MAIPDNAIFAAQAAGGSLALYGVSNALLPQTGSPCFVPGPQGGYVQDESRSFGPVTILTIGLSTFYTGWSLVGVLAHKVSKCFGPQPHRE